MPSSTFDLTKRSPLLASLQQLASEARERYSNPFLGFDNIGLSIGRGQPSRSIEYWCTPLNSKCFGGIAGAGAHVSFLCEEGDYDWEHLPVVLSVPEAIDNANVVLGESLGEFLCLGCEHGYFALEQLAHYLRRALDVYAAPRRVDALFDEWECGVGFALDEKQLAILEFIRGELGLTPWSDLKARFHRLQEMYLPRVRLPDNPE